MRKNIAAIFVTIMLLAQIGIAQHNVVHFDAHGHYEHYHDEDDRDDHRKNAHEACQICLSTKTLSVAVIPDHTYLVVPTLWAHDHNHIHDQITPTHRPAFYNPRAPPVALI